MSLLRHVRFRAKPWIRVRQCGIHLSHCLRRRSRRTSLFSKNWTVKVFNGVTGLTSWTVCILVIFLSELRYVARSTFGLSIIWFEFTGWRLIYRGLFPVYDDLDTPAFGVVRLPITYHFPFFHSPVLASSSFDDGPYLVFPLGRLSV